MHILADNQNKKVNVSAPGKLMLFGEHAVVYGKPCIATSVDQRFFLKINAINEEKLELIAPDVKLNHYNKELNFLGKGDIPKGAEYVEYAVLNMFNNYKIRSGIRIETKSDFSAEIGFGSSSASAVCTVKAISELFDLNLSKKEIFDIAFKTVIDLKGVGSGYDIACAIYGGTIYYISPGKIIEKLDLSELNLIVGNTGYKSVTADVITQVRNLEKAYPFVVDDVYNQIEKVVDAAKEACKANDLIKLGELMNINQGYLDVLQVNDRILSDMIYVSRDAGALGAKISGSGLGDCMIALVTEDKKQNVIEAINSTKGKYIEVKTNVEGVRVE